MNIEDYKFNFSDCPVVPARPCAKCEKQQQMLETMAEALGFYADTQKVRNALNGCENLTERATNILTTYKQFMEGK